MNRNELISAVALAFIRNYLRSEQGGTIRFCMLGLEASLVCSIAKAVMSDPELKSIVLVKIPSQFDRKNELSAEVISDQSITHWRHYPLSGDFRAILFAASQDELQQNDKSLEKVSKIETDTLRNLYEDWITLAGLTSMYIDEQKKRHLCAALQSANTIHAARTIETFADFILSITFAIKSKGLPLQKAVDYALPSLRLPRNSGHFDRIPVNRRDSLSEWNKVFRRLLSKVRPFLVLQTEKGEEIPKDDLLDNFGLIKNKLNDIQKDIIKNFLDSDLRLDYWSKPQEDFVKLDWGITSELFEGVGRRTTVPLGEETHRFFIDEFDDLLNDLEIELLSKTFPREPSEDLKSFFESYREHLAQNKKLTGKWERYIYRNPKTHHDFFVGLLDTLDSLRLRVSDDELQSRNLLVRIPNAERKSFWSNKNPKVARYFAFRYKGLKYFFNGEVEFDFGKLNEYYFPVIDEELAKVTSGSKEARTIKFEMILDPDGFNEKLMFHWEMPVDALATAMPDDLYSIANFEQDYALLSTANVTRQAVSAQGLSQGVSLNDVNTIRDVTGTNNGLLVALNDPTVDCSGNFLDQLIEFTDILGQDTVNEIRNNFLMFLAAYTKAVRLWLDGSGPGISSRHFIEQAEAFNQLISILLKKTDSDIIREKLWRIILRIGVINIEAGKPASIVAPWHPLRLAEIYIKAAQVTDLIKLILKAEEGDILRADLFFSQVGIERASNYYPEICIGFLNDKPLLQAAIDTLFDYSLMEPPLKIDFQVSDDAPEYDAQIIAEAFSDVIEQYLKLLPHERSNLSILLYNTEAKKLPNALAAKLSEKLEQDSQLQCDLLMAHSDQSVLRELYEQQNTLAEIESGSIIASEAAENFLSRLRLGFYENRNTSSDTEVREVDIVALKDLAAQSAQLVWKPTPGRRQPQLEEHVPSRWSRSRPVGIMDTAVSKYLVCPVQPSVGQSYINLIHKFLEGDNALPGSVLPAREIQFRDGGELGEVLARVHEIGEWVVNYDDLIEQRLLTNSGISVIRHIRNKHSKRNLVVSTTTEPKLLHALLKDRLNYIDHRIVEDNPKIINTLIRLANKLSGQVIMRAARYGHYANELLGVVLSMSQIKSSLSDSEGVIGWYFLDDFASWFGQREEKIADIMAITPIVENGRPILKIVISEAKFVTSDNYKAQARQSAKQLEETVARLSRAFKADQRRIDREIWLNLIGDLMIEGLSRFDDGKTLAGWDLHRWSDEVRQDNVTIQLVGFSHVFVHDEQESVESSDTTFPLKGAPFCSQQIFNKSQIAKILWSLAENKPALPDRENIENIWDDDLNTQGVSNVVHETRSSRENVHIADKKKKEKQLSDSNKHVKLKDGLDKKATKLSGLRKSGDLNKTGLENNTAIEKEVSMSQWPSEELFRWVHYSNENKEDSEEIDKWLADTVTRLQRALRSYDMSSELIGARITPNAALIRFKGSDDLTIPKVERKKQELLTSHAIDVIDILAAPMEVIIMVKRPQRAILRLEELWQKRKFSSSSPISNASVVIGAKEADGEILYLNLGGEFAGFHQHAPHTLIAGETGSGKGVLIQTMLLDICATNSPEMARIKMIDPKAGIDFPWLRKMPHLDGDLITEQSKAISLFEELVVEMERRNRLLAESGVTKIENYNNNAPESERLPRIWLFHDELADWMLIDEYRDAVDLNARRLGQKARAAGINLVLITQRPDKESMPVMLRSNLGNRLVLKMADRRNSELVLDEAGAEKLLGKGHLAAKLSGEGETILAQVPFLDEKEIMELAQIIKRAWEV